MNNPDVKKSLHVEKAPFVWDLCNGTINEQYNRNKTGNGSIDVYERLYNKYRILKYSGDTDMAVPTYGTRDWIDNLNWEVTSYWRQFMVDGQVGGYVETRNNGNFVFATIHGAGHMAPQWRPAPTYRAVFNFINNRTL